MYFFSSFEEIERNKNETEKGVKGSESSSIDSKRVFQLRGRSKGKKNATEEEPRSEEECAFSGKRLK